MWQPAVAAAWRIETSWVRVPWNRPPYSVRRQVAMATSVGCSARKGWRAAVAPAGSVRVSRRNSMKVESARAARALSSNSAGVWAESETQSLPMSAGRAWAVEGGTRGSFCNDGRAGLKGNSYLTCGRRTRWDWMQCGWRRGRGIRG